MSATVNRNAMGQFVGSGNPKGRPRKKRPLGHGLPEVNRHTVLEVAQMEVKLRDDAGNEIGTTTAYQAALQAMAKSALKEGNHVAQRNFVSIVDAAAARGHELDMMARYLYEENAMLRRDLAKLEEKFPKWDGHGVVIEQADGSLLPAAWDTAIKSGNLKKPELEKDQFDGDQPPRIRDAIARRFEAFPDDDGLDPLDEPSGSG